MSRGWEDFYLLSFTFTTGIIQLASTACGIARLIDQKFIYTLNNFQSLAILLLGIPEPSRTRRMRPSCATVHTNIPSRLSGFPRPAQHAFIKTK